MACTVAWRIRLDGPIMQSSRVSATICRMVETPRPSSPTRSAQAPRNSTRSEEHTSELQSLMRTSYARFCLKQKHNLEHIALHLINIKTAPTFYTLQKPTRTPLHSQDQMQTKIPAT